MKGDLGSLIFALIFVPTMLLGWLFLSNHLRLRRVRRDYLRVPSDVRQQVLNRIHAAGLNGSVCSVLVATESNATARDVVASRYGGVPYAEVGDDWPLLDDDTSDPAGFLIQVKLDDTFPPPWPGRLVVVFNRHDATQTVRCYTSPAADRSIPLAVGPPLEHDWMLQHIRVPRQPRADDAVSGAHADGGLLDYDPVVLLPTIPGLNADLLPFTRRPADLLAAILAPNHCGYGFELSDIVQLGGQPEWLLEELEGCNCDQCGRTMRFLFQFGDLNGGTLLGDSGVCYVFGCDEHPETPMGIVQTG